MFLPLEQITQLLLQYKYLILFPIVMVEGPITTLVAGFLSSLGYLNFPAAYLIIAIADLTSDIGYYLLGRFGREKFIFKYGRWFGLTLARIEKLEKQFNRRGGQMIIFGKIVDPLSAAIQTAAGAAKMRFSSYLLFNIAATFPKSLILLTIGFYFGEAISQIDALRQKIGLIVSALGLVALFIYFIYRRQKQKEIEKDD